MFKPHLAKFVGPIYAVAQGFFLGAISKGVRDVLRRHRRAGRRRHDRRVRRDARALPTRIIKVTDRFRRIVIGATIGIMVFYGVCFLIQLFAGSDSISFLSSPSLLGIGFSVFVAGLAAMNLALDFDFIDRGVEAGLDEGLRVVRGVRPAGHDRVALPRDAATAGQAPRAVTPAPGADSRGRTPSIAEAAITAIAGASLGALAGAPFGLSIPLGAVAGINGAVCGWRGTYDWRSPVGVAGFVLDSTWAFATTAARCVAARRGRRARRPAVTSTTLSRAPEPPRLRARLPDPPRIRDHARQRRRRRRRSVERAPAPSLSPTTRTCTCGRRAGSARCIRCCTAGGWSAGRSPALRVWAAVAAREPLRQGRRVVRLLPQPVRVVGLQPRRPLAAEGPRRRHRLEASGGAAVRPRRAMTRRPT